MSTIHHSYSFTEYPREYSLHASEHAVLVEVGKRTPGHFYIPHTN